MSCRIPGYLNSLPLSSPSTTGNLRSFLSVYFCFPTRILRPLMSVFKNNTLQIDATNNVVWVVSVQPWPTVTFCFCCYSHWCFYLLKMVIEVWFNLLFWEVISVSLASEALCWTFGEKGNYVGVWRLLNDCISECLKSRCWYVSKSLCVPVTISICRNWHNGC